MNPIDEYVRQVLDHIPRCLPGRADIEADLRSHLADRIEAGDTPESAIALMGSAEVVARELLKGKEFVPASVIRRTGAFLIDIALGVVLAFPTAAFVVFMWNLHELGGLIMIVAGVVAVVTGITGLVVGLAYFPVTEKLYGQTVGKHLLDLCVTKENGERIGWVAAIVRRIPFYAEFFMLDALVAIFTKRKQRAFDLVAETIVIDLKPRRGQ